jgi:hypothetical protein
MSGRLLSWGAGITPQAVEISDAFVPTYSVPRKWRTHYQGVARSGPLVGLTARATPPWHSVPEIKR